MTERSQTVPAASRWRLILDVVTSVVFISGTVALVYGYWRSTSRPLSPPASQILRVPADPIPGDSTQIEGSRNAPVEIVEFSDFECPFCRRFARETLPGIRREFIETGKALLLFHNLPLPIHPAAVPAATAAICASRQGAFWPMHDGLFAGDANPDKVRAFALAADLGLDRARFGTCFDTGVGSDIEADVAAAHRLGITGTPAFLIGTRLPDGRVRVLKAFSGAMPLSLFRQVIEGATPSPTGWRSWPLPVALAASVIGLGGAFFLSRRSRAASPLDR